MAVLGFRCGKDAIARMMREDGYSLQGMSRVLEGNQHPDRDAQFRHINEQIAAFGAAGDPVVSVDAKKKEQLGPFHRAGRTWRRAGDPVKVRDHDFPDEELGKITRTGSTTSPRTGGSSPPDEPRHRGVRGERAAAVVAARGQLPLPGGTAAAGHLRRLRVQRLPVPLWKEQRPPWRRRPGWRSRCATSRPARPSGTRSSTGCSATSPAPGGHGR